MGCCPDRSSILSQLKELVGQIDKKGTCPPPCSVPVCPCPYPYAEVCMTCPPPIIAPTQPTYVKPLQLPCPKPCPEPEMSPDEAERTRRDNFYNGYNMEWRNNGDTPRQSPKVCSEYKQTYGVTVDGKSPCCDLQPPCDPYPLPGCPTGFKPCTMALTPPPGCSPCGVWMARIEPCPVKPRNAGGCGS